jgi:hypothetical protein
MTARRTAALAALLVAGGLAVGGCAAGKAEGAAPATVVQAATLQEGKDGGPGVVRLSGEAEQRLGIRTAPVTVSGGALLIPYGAVVYQPDGTSWAYVQIAPRAYQRQPITIGSIAGDQATLGAGPPPGALVVSQGGAELVGVETGIDGEE